MTRNETSSQQTLKRRNNGRAPVRQRLKREERRHLILAGARKAFSKSGDLNGTTIKAIAQEAKISEGVIYQHFTSKEELFFAAIVEPLRDAVETVVNEVGDFNPLRAQDEDIGDLTRRFWATMIKTMEQVLPLMGLVLFGETARARSFYRGPFTDAVNELADTWQRIYDQHGMAYNAREVALSSIGIAIAFSLDSRYRRGGSDLAASLDALAVITQGGFWPQLPSADARVLPVLT